MIFGEKLKLLREEKGLTQQDVADVLNVGRATIAGYETKGKQPDYEKLTKLAEFFDTSIDYLLGRMDNSNIDKKISESTENKTLSEKIKQLRKEKDITQKELAETLSISPSTIAMYETGQRKPDSDMLETIADFFNVSVDYLLGRSNIKNPEEKQESPKKNKDESSFIKEDSSSYDIDELEAKFEKLYPKIRQLSREEKDKLLKIIDAYLEE